MCFCTPNIRTPFCNNCNQAMFLRISELKQQRDELLAALKLWKLASDNAEESELDDMACYCVPMPLFCDADEATGAIAAFNKFEGGE